MGSFPSLTNFRLGKLRGWKRVFSHPAAIFFERKIARLNTMEIASLSIEPCKDSEFYVSLFEIPSSEIPAFYDREEEFQIQPLPVRELLTGNTVTALACTRGSDRLFIERWGEERFNKKYREIGIDTIWNVKGPIYPCRVYLRHCVLAVQKQGKDVLDDFLDNTFLYDRKTTVRQHLASGSDILAEKPPPSLSNRYNG
ncbi:hypothetical protein AAMO2058_000042000 [Amorphochlora amoebiformis]